MYQHLLPYLVAIALTAIALLLTIWLKSLLYPIISTFFYIAIIFSTWYGGLRPGFVAVVLSTLAIDYFLIYPSNKFSSTPQENFFRLGIFFLVALIINVFSSNLLDSQQKIKQLNQKIQESVESLTMAAGAAEIGMWRWDLVKGKIYWSPEHELLFDLVPGSFDGKYETFVACLHPDDRERVTQALQQAITNDSLYQQEFRVVWADGSVHWIEGKGHAFYNQEKQPILMTGIAVGIDDRKQAQSLVEQQFEQQNLVMEVTQRIRTSLDLPDILQTTVDEIRRLLKTDRVIIFQFSPNWNGTVIVESVDTKWTAILSTEIYDPCFGERYVEFYKNGLITAKSDIYQAGIDPCHLELLANFQVKANLVVPISKQDQLWGLLIAHHCENPRQWQFYEIELMRQLAAQVSIAIQQSELFSQLQTELNERKKIEAYLRESELRYRSLVNASAQIIWHSDAEGRTIIAPTGWEELTGQSAINCLEWGWLNMVHPDDRDRVAQIWSESCINRTIYETEFRIRIKDGSYRDFAVRGVPILDTNGEVIEWIGACQDITERQQARMVLQQMNAELVQRVAERTAELVQANDRLQEGLILKSRLQRELLKREKLLDGFFNAASSASIGLAIHDRQLNYMKINQALADLDGFSIEAFLGRNIAEMLPHLAEEIIPAMQRVIETGQSIRRLEISEKNPTQPELLHYWLVSHFPIFGEIGEVMAVGTILLDITERKRIEEALKLTHHQLSFHVENTPLATIVWDDKFRVKQWSKQAEKIFGWTAEEVFGKTMFDWQFIFVEDLEIVKSVQSNLLKGNTMLCNNRNYRKDGTLVYCEWYNSALLDELGNLVSVFSLAQDVTDRKQAEIAREQANAQLQEANQELEETLQELQLAEEEIREANYQLEIALLNTQLQQIRYEDLFNFAPDGYLVTDTNGNIQEANQAASNLLLTSSFNLVNQPLNIYIFEPDRPIFYTSLNQLRGLLGRQTYELRIKPRQGQPFPAGITASTICNPEREVIGIRWLIKSLSEQKQAEAALQQSEERRRLALDLTKLGFWDLNLLTKEIIWNDNHFNLLGLIPNQTQPSYELWLNSVHPEDANYTEQRFLSSLESRTDYQAEYRVIYPDGSIHWLMARGKAIYDESTNQPLRSLGVIWDISEQKKVEVTLRETEEKFRQLAENIQTAFWIKDIETQKIIYLSNAYENIWQRSCESVHQNILNWLETVHPDDRQSVEAIFLEVENPKPCEAKYRIIRPDGSIRWIRDRAFPIANEAGEIVRIAGIAEDITEKQQIEQMKEEFIGIVSHELRTPLTGIQMSLGLLQTGVYNQNTAKFQRMLDIALTDTNRLVNLVNDILHLERLESGKSVLEKTNCQAIDLIQQAVNGMEALATSQQVRLQINFCNVQVWAARDAIVQTLTNLLSNALKFSSANSTITLSAESQTDMVLFQVKDEGRGIPADKLEAIFGRFQQVDSSDSREKGGTGLGLAICQSIIHQHGGKIWVESTLGKGSTFFFTLPKQAD
ncbi:PAS domain S-box protein [Aerosakkonemataceae cyanobacterium BLCC-F154]|uniref:histidine kinase n=1 Tax=Floridaenema fluviatile BLCC-F154 TaxID=3153640 RepID=A0ABV4YL15_9CYAN